jgi:hypothetical protein
MLEKFQSYMLHPLTEESGAWAGHGQEVPLTRRCAREPVRAARRLIDGIPLPHPSPIRLGMIGLGLAGLPYGDFVIVLPKIRTWPLARIYYS